MKLLIAMIVINVLNIIGIANNIWWSRRLDANDRRLDEQDRRLAAREASV